MIKKGGVGGKKAFICNLKKLGGAGGLPDECRKGAEPRRQSWGAAGRLDDPSLVRRYLQGPVNGGMWKKGPKGRRGQPKFAT